MAVEQLEVDEAPGTTGRGLRWHALILAVLLVAVWPFLTLGGAVFTTDEGSYALQARVLSEGTWDMGYAFVEEDPEGRFLPYVHSRIVDDEVLVDARYPFWPVILGGSVWAFGEGVGLRIIGVASVLALAVVAWSIADRLGGPRAARWAFWVGATSPVLANAWLLWAHAPSAAVAALLVLAGLRCRERAAWIGLAAVAAAVTVLLRPEGLLWAIALAIALCVVGAGSHQRVCGAVVGVSAAVGWWLEARWTDALISLDSQITPRRGGAEAAERGFGLILALVGQDSGSTVRPLLGVLALGLASAAFVVMRFGRPSVDPRILVAGSAAALGLRLLMAPSDAPIGLLVAAPVLMLSGAVPRLERGTWFLPATCTLFLGAVGLSIHPNGGGFQWGGRYLSPMLGVLAVLVGLAVASILSHRPARHAGLVLASLLAVQAIGMVAGPDAERARNVRGLSSLAALGPSVTITMGDTTARLDWETWPDRCWLAVREQAGIAEIAEAFDVLTRSGVTRLSYLRMDRDLLETAGARIEETHGVMGVITLDPQPVRSAISPPYRCDQASQ